MKVVARIFEQTVVSFSAAGPISAALSTQQDLLTGNTAATDIDIVDQLVLS